MLAACLSLFALQMSGLHMHVDDHGYAGTPQGTHIHSQVKNVYAVDAHLDHHGDDKVIAGHNHAGDHDFEGDKDLSVVDLLFGTSKIPIFLVWLGLCLFSIIRSGDKFSSKFSYHRPTGRRARWRPPLRAPPIFS